jgi:hypothetical protein
MKTNVQVKDEPVELQVNELLRLYGYNVTDQSTIKTPRTKLIANQEQECMLHFKIFSSEKNSQFL